MKKITSIIFNLFYIFLIVSTVLCVFCNNEITEIVYLIANIVMAILILFAFFQIEKKWCRYLAIIGELLNIANVILLIFFDNFLWENHTFNFFLKITTYVILMIVSFGIPDNTEKTEK